MCDRAMTWVHVITHPPQNTGFVTPSGTLGGSRSGGCVGQPQWWVPITGGPSTITALLPRVGIMHVGNRYFLFNFAQNIKTALKNYLS